MIDIYLLGGPNHGETHRVKSCTTYRARVQCKTHTAYMVFECMYRSSGLMDPDDFLIFKYDESTARFIHSKLSANLDEYELVVCREISDGFASGRLRLIDKIKILKEYAPEMLQDITRNRYGACKIPISGLQFTVPEDRETYLHISNEEARQIKDSWIKVEKGL